MGFIYFLELGEKDSSTTQRIPFSQVPWSIWGFEMSNNMHSKTYIPPTIMGISRIKRVVMRRAIRDGTTIRWLMTKRVMMRDGRRVVGSCERMACDDILIRVMG